MPHRWPSTRECKEEQKDFKDIKHPQDEFDFQFTEPQALVDCGRIQNVERLRPTTATGNRDCDNIKRKPDLTLLIERPRSSDSAYSKTTLPARPDSSEIGLAFGSPRHPPQEFASMASTMGPQLRQLACCDGDDNLLSANKTKKWKLSPFFKQRMNAQKDSRQVWTSSPDGNKLGVPIQRTPWRNPKSPPLEQMLFTDEAPPPPPEKDECYCRPLGPVARSSIRTDAVPVVEVSIPATPLDRISVMFKDVDGFAQSALLVRRSKDLDSLMLTEPYDSRTRESNVSQLHRRATSPSIRPKQDFQLANSSNSNLQKYSLFPATPTKGRSSSSGTSPRDCYRRSVTAPVSSKEGSAGSVERKKIVREPLQTVLHDSVKSQELYSDLKPPVVISANADSRISSNSEIFFDIRSFRNSSGQTGHHFEMTRAPPPTGQSTRPKPQDHRSQHLTDYSRTSSRQAAQSTAQQIDQTIEAIERLALPSSTPLIPPSVSAKISQHVPQSTRVADTSSLCVKKSSRKGSLRSRVGSFSLGGSSSVVEAAEEAILRPNKTLHSDQHKPTQEVISESTPCQVSSPSAGSQSPQYATVVKDVHNIPLSRYAPKRTTEELVRQTGLRPVRPGRANTDNSISYDPRSSRPHQPTGPSRSSTLPVSGQAARSKQASQSVNLPDPHGSHWQDVPVKITYVAPTAEVSVARTVSLSRKPSTKITVARHEGHIDSKPGPEQITEKSVALGIAILQEVNKKHKYGQSLGVVLEAATIGPSPQTLSPGTFGGSIPSDANLTAAAI